jgi:hypothetical protein
VRARHPCSLRGQGEAEKTLPLPPKTVKFPSTAVSRESANVTRQPARRVADMVPK